MLLSIIPPRYPRRLIRYHETREERPMWSLNAEQIVLPSSRVHSVHHDSTDTATDPHCPCLLFRDHWSFPDCAERGARGERQGGLQVQPGVGVLPVESPLS